MLGRWFPLIWEIEMIVRALACCCALSISSLAMAQTPPAPATPKATASEEVASAEVVYGHQLMTDAERTEYRAKMRSLKTPAERQAFRLEHHQQMQIRAKEKGVTLPEMPPQGGMRQGMGGGPGGGMRQGMKQGMQSGGASTSASTSSSSAP